MRSQTVRQVECSTNGWVPVNGPTRVVANDGQSGKPSDRTYLKGVPEAATSERLPSGDPRCERLLLSDPAVRFRRL